MKASKRTKLEAAGWKVGSTTEFLELNDAESILIDMKLALARTVKDMRKKRQMTQEDLASQIGSSQSRIAKIEAADASVSIELFIKSLVALGASRLQIGNILGNETQTRKHTKQQKIKA